MIMLSEAKFFLLNTYFSDKNGLHLINFGSVAKIENESEAHFFLPIFIDKIFIRVLYLARNMTVSFQSKIMIMKKFSISSAYNL